RNPFLALGDLRARAELGSCLEARSRSTGRINGLALPEGRRPAVAAQGTRIDVPIRERESSSRALDGHIARTASAGHTARRARSATRRARGTTRRAGNTRPTAGVARHQPAGAVVVVVARALAVIASGACHEAQGKRCQAKANQ